jgi:hypothetical protein
MTGGIWWFVPYDESLRLFCQLRSSDLRWRFISSVFKSMRIGIIIIWSCLCGSLTHVSRFAALLVLRTGYAAAAVWLTFCILVTDRTQKR